MKNGSKGKALASVLLLVPIVFIAYFIYIYASQNIDESAVKSVTLKMPNGSEIVYEDAENIGFYVNAVLDAAVIPEKLRETSDSDAIILSCDRGDKILQYKIYPELSLSGCMLDKDDGKIYVLDTDTARAFLSRSECAYLYSSRQTPPLLVNTGDSASEVWPDEYNWNYKLMSGTFTEYHACPAYDGTVYSLYSDRQNSLSFAAEPQTVSVELTSEDGSVLPYADVAKLIFAGDTLINVRVTAEWTRAEDSVYYGKAVYVFKVLYDIPAVIELSADTVKAGGYILVNARYLNDSESVTLESELKTSTLAFSENSGVKTAALAVDISAQPGDYTLNFIIGGNLVSESLNVTKREEDFVRLSVSSSEYNRLLGDSARAEIADVIRQANGSVSLTAYGDPAKEFANPSGTAKTDSKFGAEVLMNLDGGTDSRVCNSICDTYKSVDGARVYAAKSGKVVYSGTTQTMGTVLVIDHGCGLQSWYFFLKSAERSVGTEVREGEVVGFAGTCDYTSEPEICFAVSVCGTFTGN